MRWCRFLFSALLLSFFFSSARADAISDFVESGAINAPSTAVMITDLSSGEVIVAHNIDKPLVPASIMKCVTTASLLEKTGHNYEYKTDVFTTGRESDGTLKGDLVVVASGDPSLNSRHLPDGGDFTREIAEALRLKGIRNITGSIRIDESVFSGPAINPQWATGDLPHAYGTGSHGLNFEDNASGKSSVKDPAAIFRSRLTTILQSEGISILNESEPENSRRHLLISHNSLPIDEIMRSCMMRSDNQYAEALLRTIAVRNNHPGSAEEGAKIVLSQWKKHHAPEEGVTIVDGSGLSRANRMTAQFMTHLLRFMAANPYYASFFPLAGQEGTLRKFLAGTELDSYIAMKTGSMNGIQCYAGYRLDDNYVPTHTVVVMLNDMADRSAARAQVEKLLLNTLSDEYIAH